MGISTSPTKQTTCDEHLFHNVIHIYTGHHDNNDLSRVNLSSTDLLRP